jgi:hypothetical protein
MPLRGNIFSVAAEQTGNSLGKICSGHSVQGELFSLGIKTIGKILSVKMK